MRYISFYKPKSAESKPAKILFDVFCNFHLLWVEAKFFFLKVVERVLFSKYINVSLCTSK